MKIQNKFLVVVYSALLILCLFSVATKASEDIAVGDIGKVFQQVDTPLNGNGLKEYKLTSTADEKIPITDGQSIYFVATPLTGDVDLYVSVQGKPNIVEGHCTNCISEGVTAHGEVVSLSYNSLNYPSGDEYSFYISILTHDNAPAAFTFTVTLSDEGPEKRGTTTTMVPAFPQTGQVTSKKYNYFKYVIPDVTEIDGLDDGDDIVITVTPIGGGDPDLYVDTSEFPDKENYKWKSAMWSSDQIVISKSDENYPEDKTIYIAVYGFSSTVDTYFILQAHVKRNYAVVLDGAAQNYNGKHDIQRYKFILAKAQEIAFVVNPLSFRGDPDIYVTDEVEQDTPVSPSHYKWKSVGIGSDTIRFKSDKPNNEPGAKQWYYIAVKSYAALKYSLMVTTEGTPTLLESGKPIRGLTETGSPSFFRYFHVDRLADINMVVEPSNASPINVFLSTPASNNPKPDGSVNDGVASQSGIRSYYTKQRAEAGTYHFGAFATAPGPQNFTMTVTSNSTVAVLRDGVSIPFNSIARDGYRFFMFQIAEELKDDVFVLVSPYSGSEVDLYVSTDQLLTRPTKESCTEEKCWTSASYKADSIIIKPGDDRVNENTRTFFIGIAGRTYDENRFRIVAFTSQSDVELADGQPTDGSVEVGKSMYFKFYVKNNEKLDIELFQSAPAEDMNVDLFGSLYTEKPDRSNCQTSEFHCQTSTNIGANDLISLNVHGAPRYYYIGVTGISSPDGSPISFRVTARAKYHVIDHAHSSLIEQTPQDTVQEIQVSNIYSIAKFAVITNTLISGRTELYLNPNNTGVNVNDLSQSLYSNKDWPGNVLVIKNEGTHPDTHKPMSEYFKAGEWSVGVRAVSDANYITSVQQSTFFLWDNYYLDNLPHLSGVPKGERLHFQYFIKYKTGDYGKPAEEDVVLNIRALQGFVSVYMGTTFYSEPRPGSNQWNATVSGNRMLTIPKEDLIQGHSIYITIIGPSDSPEEVSIFELTMVSPSEPSFLTQDQPVLNTVSPFKPRYYKMLNLVTQNEGLEQKVEIVAESCNWNPPPKLYFSTKYARPNESHSDLTSTSSTTTSYITTKISDNSQIYYLQSSVDEHSKYTAYSITGTTNGFIRPILSYNKLDAEMEFDNGNVAIKLLVPIAQRPAPFQDKPLRYTFYAHEAPTLETSLQMETACGVKSNLQWKGEQMEKVDEKKNGPIEHTLLLDANKIWQMNVLVDDGFGMASVYNGLYYKDGQIYTSYPGVFNQMEVSVGSILILMVFTGFLLYIHIGSFVNLVFLNKDGSDIVPNKTFWISLPFIFVDGVLFVFTCGRRSTSYDPMSNANVNYDGETYDDSVEVSADDVNDKQQDNSTEGYGGI